MVIDERVTALEKEVADLKRQLEDRPVNDQILLLELRKKKLLVRLEITPLEQRPIVLDAIARLDYSAQSLKQQHE